MALRLLGCALIVLCTTACGFMLAGRLMKRQKFLAALALFVSSLSTELRYSGEDIFVLVKRCGEGAELGNFKCFEGNGECSSFAEVWQAWADKTAAALHLLQPERELLCGLGAGLGATDLEGQLEHLRLYLCRAEALLERARLDGANKSKLYKTLGFFAGCCAAVMMI